MDIPKMEIKETEIVLIGDSPLIVHAWSTKAKEEMAKKQQKKATQGKKAKDPWADATDCLYWISKRPAKPKQADLENGVFGFPSVAFKAAAVRAAKSLGMPMTDARSAFQIPGELVPIECPGGPVIREDAVRLQGQVADLRYRPEFRDWKVRLRVRFNPFAISEEQLVTLFTGAGFGTGVGEWRPEKNGNHGTFHVQTDE